MRAAIERGEAILYFDVESLGNVVCEYHLAAGGGVDWRGTHYWVLIGTRKDRKKKEEKTKRKRVLGYETSKGKLVVEICLQ